MSEITGKWKGWYEYGHTYRAELWRKREDLEFFLEENNKIITGKVWEQWYPELPIVEGVVKGYIEGNIVDFLLLFPTTMRFDKDEKPLLVNAPHPEIHYSGKLNEAGNKILGTWSLLTEIGGTYREEEENLYGSFFIERQE